MNDLQEQVYSLFSQFPKNKQTSEIHESLQRSLRRIDAFFQDSKSGALKEYNLIKESVNNQAAIINENKKLSKNDKILEMAVLRARIDSAKSKYFETVSKASKSMDYENAQAIKKTKELLEQRSQISSSADLVSREKRLQTAIIKYNDAIKKFKKVKIAFDDAKEQQRVEFEKRESKIITMYSVLKKRKDEFEQDKSNFEKMRINAIANLERERKELDEIKNSLDDKIDYFGTLSDSSEVDELFRNAELILGLDPDYSKEELRFSYRQLSKIYHPDLFFSRPISERELAEKKFKKIKTAYEFLMESYS